METEIKIQPAKRYSIKEASSFLGISDKTLYRWIEKQQEGIFPISFKIEHNIVKKSLVIKGIELLKLIQYYK